MKNQVIHPSHVMIFTKTLPKKTKKEVLYFCQELTHQELTNQFTPKIVREYFENGFKEGLIFSYEKRELITSIIKSILDNAKVPFVVYS